MTVQLNTLISGDMAGFAPTVLGSDVRPEDMTDNQLLNAFRTTPVDKLVGHVLVYRNRHGLSEHWYPEDVIAYALEGITPERASNGVWVRSVLRDTRQVMTLRESKAWLLGEISLPEHTTRQQACTNIRNLLVGAHGDVVYQWSEEEVFLYTRDSMLPVRTARGSFKHSPLREIRPVAQWQDNEIVDVIDSLISPPTAVTVESLYGEARKRWMLPPAWDNSQVYDYLVNELEPPTNEDGIWIVDQTRKDKPFKEWSDAELVAWVRGEIQLEGRLRPRGAYHEMRQRYHYPDSTPDDVIHEDVLTSGLGITERPLEYLLIDMSQFVLVMSSIGATNEQRAFAHSSLYKSLMRTLQLPIEVFEDAWNTVLDIAYDNIGLFSTDKIYRSIFEMNATNKTREVYQLLLVSITDTMVPDMRFSKTVDSFYTLFELLRNIEIESKLKIYYGV